MNNKDIISQFVFGAIYLVLQTIFLHNVMLFNGAFCFVYIAILLLMPFKTPTISLMLIGFGIGFMIDLSYSVLGIHTAATVLLAYLRNAFIKRLEPNGGYDGGAEPVLANMGLTWFMQYVVPLTFLHHALVFFVEVSNRSLALITLGKVLGSTLFTVLVILLIQYIFYKK